MESRGGGKDWNGMERTRVSLGINDVYEEARLEEHLRDQVALLCSKKAFSWCNLRRSIDCMTTFIHTDSRQFSLIIALLQWSLADGVVVLDGYTNEHHDDGNGARAV